MTGAKKGCIARIPGAKCCVVTDDADILAVCGLVEDVEGDVGE